MYSLSSKRIGSKIDLADRSRRTLLPMVFFPLDAAIDLAERPVLQDLRKTFGKTIHTWQYDVHPELPLGPPQMML